VVAELDRQRSVTHRVGLLCVHYEHSEFSAGDISREPRGRHLRYTYSVPLRDPLRALAVRKERCASHAGRHSHSVRGWELILLMRRNGCLQLLPGDGGAFGFLNTWVLGVLLLYRFVSIRKCARHSSNL
jgi:hypothetical protein